jgi:hypothetical protein
MIDLEKRNSRDATVYQADYLTSCSAQLGPPVTLVPTITGRQCRTGQWNAS